MKGMAAAPVPTVSAVPRTAASDCLSRTNWAAGAAPACGALSPLGTAAVRFGELGPVQDGIKGRTLSRPETVRSATPSDGGACPFAWPPRLVRHATAGDTSSEGARTSAATAVRRDHFLQQGRIRSIGDR
jgi:hypothetical protein